MSLSKSSFASIPTCYATVSVGTPQHSLREKLEAITNAGFQGIELGFPDLLNWACKYHDREVDDHDWTSLSDAAKVVRKWCEEHNLKVVMLQPFGNFEGWPADSEERKDAFRRAKGWITIMKSLGCDMLQVSCSMIPPRKYLSPTDLTFSRSGQRTLQTSTPHPTRLPRIFESFATF